LEKLLDKYSAVSRARINWDKSKLTPLSLTAPMQDSRFSLTPMQKPPATLGFSFPLNQQNIDDKWEELYGWMGRKMGMLKS